MRHRKSGRKFSRTSAHRKALFRTLAASLILHERIQTTLPKAKELRSYVEKLITIAKKGNRKQLVQQRLANLKVYAGGKLEATAVSKLLSDIAVRCENRPGGYTRIIPMGNRHGDNAPMAIIEFVDQKAETQQEVAATTENE